MSTTITGVHFVYRPSNATERSQVLGEVALIQRDRKVRLTGVEYSDGRIEEFDDTTIEQPREAFSVKIQWLPDDKVWITELYNANGWSSGEYVRLGDAIGQALNDILNAGGGDWTAVNRRTGEVV